MKQIPHSKPFIDEKEVSAASKVVRSGMLSQGKEVSALEIELAAKTGHLYGVAVNSGTTALYVALQSLGITNKDSVIIPTWSCTAPLNAVSHTGAKPLLADVSLTSHNLTVETVRPVIRRNTKAIISPHLFGIPAPNDELKSLGIPIIEDCAQCIGAQINGKKTGSLTDIATFSFYTTKLIGAGEGGLVTTSDKKIYKTIMGLREYDNCRTFIPRFNYKLTDIQAAIARRQLRKLSFFIARRKKIAKEYDYSFSKIPSITLYKEPNPKTKRIPFRYIIRVKRNTQKILKELQNRGISCARPVFKPLHRYFNQRTNAFPNAEQLFKDSLSLPLYPAMSDRDVSRVIKVVTEVLSVIG